MTFTWSGDRWEHVVELADGRRWRSTEGPDSPAGDPRWPTSPPLVEVSLVAAGSQPAVVGVGAAGRSHFSLSVVSCPDRADTLWFEAACRIREPAAWLGSTYEHAGVRQRVGAAPATPPTTVRWAYRIGPAGLESVAGADRAGPP